MESELPAIFRVEQISKKYSTWVHVAPTSSSLSSMMSLSEETYKYSEPES